MGEKEGTPGAKPEVTKPELPQGAPPALQGFVDCTGNRLRFRPGKIRWLKGQPEISFEAGEQPGSVNITVSLGIVSLTLPATVRDGQLRIDTSKIPDLSDFVEGLGPKAIDDWVKQLNDWLKSNGKQLGPLTLNEGALTIPKVAIPAGQQGAGVVPKGPEPAKPGIKAAAGTGAALLGLGLGTLLAPGDGIAATVPDDPVPIVQVEQMPEPQSQPETEEVVSLPSGQIPAEITVTPEQDGDSFSFPATFQQNGTKLVILAPPNPPFKGQIDPAGAFVVDNQVGSFEGIIDGAQVAGNHIFQGVPFSFEGTLAQPAFTETVPLDGNGAVEPPPTFAGIIGDQLVFQPSAADEGDGANLPVAGGGLLLAGLGAGLLLLGRTSKRDCRKQSAALDAALAKYRRAQALIQTRQKELEEAEDEADRVAGEAEYGNALAAEQQLRDDIEEDREDLREAEDAIVDAEEALAECEGRAERDFDEVTGVATTAEVM